MLTIDINNFCIENHLFRVMEAGCKTIEFATGAEVAFWPPDVLRLWSEHNGGPMLVAMDQRSGMIGFFFATFHDAGIATVENIYVEEGFRRRGIAHSLLNEFEKRAAHSNMKMSRVFSHPTNVATSRYLVRGGYSKGTLTQWYSGRPQSMNLTSSGELDKRILARQFQSVDLDGARCVSSLDCRFTYNAPCANCVDLSDWLFSSAHVSYGAFYGQRLVGFVVASIHEPTNKATLELFLLIKPFATLLISKSLLLPLLRDIAARGIFYVTAHPAINDTDIHCLTESLVLLGFEKGRIFMTYSKKI